MEYTLSLALEDFVPVVLSSLGLFFIRRMVLARVGGLPGRVATLGWVLITVGGLSKSTWKLIMALTDGTRDVAVLDNALFVFLAPGFVCMAWAVWRMRGGKGGWGVPAGIIATFYVLALITVLTSPGARTWVFVLLGLTTLANLTLGILLIRQAWQKGQKGMGVLFVVNLVAIFILSGLARVEPQTIPLQWIEQSINTVSQGAFALAAWRVWGGDG